MLLRLQFSPLQTHYLYSPKPSSRDDDRTLPGDVAAVENVLTGLTAAQVAAFARFIDTAVEAGATQ
jgi:hypothetical protein